MKANPDRALQLFKQASALALFIIIFFFILFIDINPMAGPESGQGQLDLPSTPHWPLLPSILTMYHGISCLFFLLLPCCVFHQYCYMHMYFIQLVQTMIYREMGLLYIWAKTRSIDGVSNQLSSIHGNSSKNFFFQQQL